MTSSVDGIEKFDAPRWQPVGRGDFGELSKARLETFNLVQWLARLGNSNVEDDVPERRIELQFRAADGALATKRFGANLALELRLPSLQMHFLEGGRPAPHIFDPDDRSPAEVEAWILVELLHRGISAEKFSKRLPYPVAGLMSGDVPHHSPRSCGRGLAELTAWLKNAAAVLDATSRVADIDSPRVVALPQTLALACICGRDQNRFGFQPGDGEEPEPYFYVAAGPAAGAIGNKRAILKASALFAKPDPAVAAMRFLMQLAND